jgi:nucleoside-diphosphate-sugar epimerase
MPNADNKKRIVILGATGFIGGYLARGLVAQGHEVVGIDMVNMYKPREWALFWRNYQERQRSQLGGLAALHRLDGSQPVETSEVIHDFEPHVVINLGGTSVADVCKRNIHEAVQSIYLLNANLLQILKLEKSLERYVYVSSSMTYGDFSSERPTEDATMRPRDPYGAIKLGGEHLVRSFSTQFDLPYTIIRPSAVYGPLDSNMRVSGIFMLNAHNGIPLRVNDVNEALDFTYVEDAAEGFRLAALHPNGLNETFNITRGEGKTIETLALEVQKQFPGTEIQYGADAEHMEGLERPTRGALSIEKAKELLGYTPNFGLNQGVAAYAHRWKEMFGEPGTPL